MRVVTDVSLRCVPQLFLGRLVLEGGREIKRNHHPVDEILRRVGIHHPLRQHEQHRLLRVVHARPEGQHACPDVPGIGGLSDVGHVLSPTDHHAVVPSSVRVEFYRKFIPFVFARTEHIEDRTRHAAQQRTEGGRNGHREIRFEQSVRPDREGTIALSVGKHSLQRIFAGVRREWRDRYLRQLVGNQCQSLKGNQELFFLL